MPRNHLMALEAGFMLFGCFMMALAPGVAMAESGRALYEKNCSSCHGADGSGNPPAVPSLAKADLSAPAIERAIREKESHMLISDSLGDEQLMAIAEYLQSL